MPLSATSECLTHLNQLVDRLSAAQTTEVQALKQCVADLERTLAQVERSFEEYRSVAATKQQLLEVILEQLPVGVIVAEAETGKIVMMNQQVQAILQTHELPQCQDQTSPFQFLRDNGQPYAPTEIPLARALYLGEVVTNEECTLVRPDGHHVSLLTNASPITNASGVVNAAVLVFSDITRRKKMEAEAAFQASILNQINSAVIATDLQGQITYWNRSAQELYQLTADLMGTSIMTVTVPADGQEIAQEILQSVQAHGSWTGEFMVQQRDGNQFPARVINTLIYDSKGQPMGFVGISWDITEQKRAEAEREHLLEREQQARRQAEAANRIKDEFLAILSHELRTPLNPILGWVKLLQTRKYSDEKVQQALTTIERNARLQLQLIDDLLDLSRIVQGKLALECMPLRLQDPIMAALETVQLSAKAKSVTIATAVNSNVGVVLGDADKLQQVIWNLLSNAIKFTPSGGQVLISLDEQEGHAILRIADTGQGIHPEFLPYLFELFRQQDSSTTRQFGGLGIGLAIVRRLVEAHGGRVMAESTGVGQGAAFTVQLPLIAAEMMGLTCPIIQEPVTEDLQGLQLLLVDDEPDSLEIAAIMLEQAGAIVRTVTSAQAACQILTQRSFDLILTDLGMPGMDGYAFLRYLRSKPAEPTCTIPVIALTAYAGHLNRQQALQAGFADHLPKPIHLSDLLQSVARIRTQFLSNREVADADR